MDRVHVGFAARVSCWSRLAVVSRGTREEVWQLACRRASLLRGRSRESCASGEIARFRGNKSALYVRVDVLGGAKTVASLA